MFNDDLGKKKGKKDIINSKIRIFKKIYYWKVLNFFDKKIQKIQKRISKNFL